MVRVSPNKVSFSRRLRRSLTDAEQRLWRNLRHKQMEGFRFRRQHPIREYVADFVCLEAKLIVEVDGGQHAENHSLDAKRTEALMQAGYRVIRFWNNEVMDNLEGVSEAIRSSLLSASNPHPNLPPSRGKE